MKLGGEPILALYPGDVVVLSDGRRWRVIENDPNPDHFLVRDEWKPRGSYTVREAFGWRSVEPATPEGDEE